MDNILFKQLNGNKKINKAFSSNAVGFCTGILRAYKSTTSEPTLYGFKLYYKSVQGLKGLSKAKHIIMEEGFSEEVAKEYVNRRVFEQTFKGTQKELEAKKMLSIDYGIETRMATPKEDLNYCIDLIGKDIAVQVKPSTYKGSNPSLDRDKKIHMDKMRSYYKLTGRKVCYLFYDSRGVWDTSQLRKIIN